MFWIVVLLVIAAQVVTGWTLSPIRARPDWPEGRWTVLLYRDDAPAVFWIVVSCQLFITGLLYLLDGLG